MSLLLRMLWLFILLVPLGAQAQGWLSPLTGQQEPEFLEAKDVFRVKATAGDNGRTLLRGEIAPGYYLYRHRLSVTGKDGALPLTLRSEENTSELQSLMRISYAVFCLNNK